MRPILQAAWKDLQRHRRDPLSLILWLAIPACIGALISLAFGGGSAPSSTPRPKLLLAESEESLLGSLLAGAGNGGAPLDVERTSIEAGRQRIDNGEASALLILPPNLARAFLDGEPANLELITNPAQRILPQMVEESLEMLLELAFYADQLFGETFRDLDPELEAGQWGLPDLRVAQLSVEVNQVMEGLQQVLLPPRLQVEFVAAEKEDAAAEHQATFLSIMLPGFLLMALLFMAQGLSEDLWKEREWGVLARVTSAPAGIRTLLAGKGLASLCVMGLAAGCVMLLAIYVLGQEFAHPIWATLWSTLTGLALLALFMPLQLLGRTRQGANMITSCVLFPLFLLGGSLFPLESMPGFIAVLSAWTPNGYALVHLRALISGTAGPEQLLLPATVLIALSCIGFGLAGLLLPRFVRRK